ncbi:hypothetical protein Cgig2_020303 [Carnegiea gigantea]|uniref:C2H2-type domain-containing protein n=1 Tax=Carnegiea gigantea TaxID=171969 RepID=A0A9Q1QDX5_9CARY|nr:hypothetical protein Cgig2_020303 [Carnegiea gigantea]
MISGSRTMSLACSVLEMHWVEISLMRMRICLFHKKKMDMLDMNDDSDDDEEDSEDDDEESSEEEEPAKAAESGKKRKAEAKTPEPKKAKTATPQKTDGKKGGHTATPHPAKKGGKTPGGDKSTPKSGGQVSCGPCKKTFNSEVALQSHAKAKHSGK